MEDFRDLRNVFIERVATPIYKRIKKFFEEKEDDERGNKNGTRINGAAGAQ